GLWRANVVEARGRASPLGAASRFDHEHVARVSVLVRATAPAGKVAGVEGMVGNGGLLAGRGRRDVDDAVGIARIATASTATADLDQTRRCAAAAAVSAATSPAATGEPCSSCNRPGVRGASVPAVRPRCARVAGTVEVV